MDGRFLFVKIICVNMYTSGNRLETAMFLSAVGEGDSSLGRPVF